MEVGTSENYISSLRLLFGLNVLLMVQTSIFISFSYGIRALFASALLLFGTHALFLSDMGTLFLNVLIHI